MNLLVVATWALGLLWLVLVPLRHFLPTSAPHDIAPVALFFMVPACGLAALLASAWADSLATWIKVLGERQVPTQLWRQRLRRGMTDAMKLWALLVLAVATVSWTGPGPWHWLTGAALISVVMVTIAANVLATRGLVPRYWRWVLLIGFLFGLATGKLGFSGALQWVNTWPTVVLVCLGVGWPLLTLVLWRRWLERMPKARWVSSMPSASLWERLRKHVLRYVPLSLSTHHALAVSGRTQRAAWHVVSLLPLVLMNPNWFGQKWGDGVGWAQLWILGFVTLFTASMLVCKDLHWRMLLAPAGLHRGRLAWHIAVSTATLWAWGLLLIATVGIAVGWGFLDVSWARVLGYLSNFCVLPVQLIFAISVATLMRSTLQPMLQGALVAVWGVGGLTVVYLTGAWSATPLSPPLFTLGWDSVAVLLALSTSALWVANRLWTVDKLLQCRSK